MENELFAAINKIIPFSNVDGPGSRMAIFFQSCPFRCYFCHNPETIRLCLHCGDCVSTCPTHALTLENDKVIWNESVCINCDTCIKTCKHLSSPKVTYMGVNELITRIHKVKPFIRGITVSGGECMNHASFLEALFAKLKEEDPSFSCLIDSNGYYDFSQYTRLLSLSDGVMLDVKAYRDEFHRFMCGVSNEMVLKNLSYLLSIQKLEEVRTVIFPVFKEENEITVTNVAKIIQSQCRYKLLRYRPYGVREEGIEILGKSICDEEEMHHYERIAKENGCKMVSII